MPITTLQIPTADGIADAFAAHPGDGAQHPGILMYADGFGIRPVIEDLALELAGHGYYVLVPNFLYRHRPAPVFDLPEFIGDDARIALTAELIPLIRSHTVEDSLRDAEAFLGFLAAQPEVAPGPMGVTGYCFGGLLATRTAAGHPAQVGAVAAFHAPVAADGPDALAAITARIHFGHAASDLTPGALADLNRSLDAADLDHTSEIYPDSVHGFTMADTDAFDAASLQQHWTRLLALLKASLG